ncbi:MAG: bifunctional folylpolyglutamate synthase/dihydrofolate synthase [Actinomycetota bacterium]|nr:bifunctional folylpolyglutamate synthase/dihydrofolate synthase [Actinomycetota bacterium]
MPAWSYHKALAELDDHVDSEAILAGRVDAPTLDRVRRLVEVMGDPQRAYPIVHITGTNGKGSTARMTTALLVTAGLSVGTYTSPDLQRVNERLAWNGEPISDGAFAEVIEAVVSLERLVHARPSRFEVLTAAAYRWFADVAVDVGVIEVGLGGRWDATNVADAQVAVVTNVSLDHAEILGPTVEEIAREKAGIVKPGSRLVLGETDPRLAPVFRRAGAAEVWERGHHFDSVRSRVAHGGRLWDLRTPGATCTDVYLPVHGSHQGENAAAALAACEAFLGAPLSEEVVNEAFAGVRLPGRMEVMSRRPLVILDGAHNPAGARAVCATLAEEFGTAPARVVVMGLLRGRDPAEMLSALGLTSSGDPGPLVLACPPPSPRALPAVEVAAAAWGMGIAAEVSESVAEALDRALVVACPDDLVLVTGSLYVVGAARAMLTDRR